MKIKCVCARQIFDSRGFPTIEASVVLENGVRGTGSAPSGASTGAHEAHERRDGGKAYGGKGVTEAVKAVNIDLNGALEGMNCFDQMALDARMIQTDGSENKQRIGANAIIAVSLACASAAANALRMPLYRYIGGIAGEKLPCPMMNVLNGGAHADNNIDIQEFMLVPVGAESFAEAMRMGTECYHALKKLLRERGSATAVGDEGGFAPNLEADEQALELLVQAIERAGYRPGEEIALALDVAASEWSDGENYRLPKRGAVMSSAQLQAHMRGLAGKYPIISLEDPLGEEDFAGFAALTERIGGSVMIVGDDLFTTNPQRIQRGVREGAANALLVKPNQIGTLSETLEAVRLARRGGYRIVLSHRSGETESTAIADIAAAVGADFIKAGAPARSERVAKYNRLLEIEEEMRGGYRFF